MSRERDAMEPASPVRASVASSTLPPAKPLRRKLPLRLYELEPESGEDERISIDLGLDQLEE
jgi:hypothetical protein